MGRRPSAKMCGHGPRMRRGCSQERVGSVRRGGQPKKATAALRPPPLTLLSPPIVADQGRSGAIELGRRVARNLEADLFLDHFRLVPFQLHGVPPDFQVSCATALMTSGKAHWVLPRYS